MKTDALIFFFAVAFLAATVINYFVKEAYCQISWTSRREKIIKDCKRNLIVFPIISLGLFIWWFLR